MRHRTLVLACTTLFTLLSTAAHAGQVVVPLDVGVGPAALLVTGPVFQDRPVHFGMRISTFAIIDQATRKKYRKRIPAKYRQLSDQAGDIRYNPLSCCIPSTLYISPAIAGTPLESTGMYGLTLKPIGVGGLFGSSNVNFQLGLGALATYIFIHSKTLPSPTHFLRPGLEARAEFEISGKGGGVSFGWTSSLYPPQEVGGSILALGKLDESIWHVGQAFLQIHVRKPVAVNLR